LREVACEVYWPDEEETAKVVKLGHFTLTLLSTDKSDPFYWVRQIQVANSSTGQQRAVTQYHVRRPYKRVSGGLIARCPPRNTPRIC